MFRSFLPTVCRNIYFFSYVQSSPRTDIKTEMNNLTNSQLISCLWWPWMELFAYDDQNKLFHEEMNNLTSFWLISYVWWLKKELFAYHGSSERSRVLTSSFNLRHWDSCQKTDQYVMVLDGGGVLRSPKQSKHETWSFWNKTDFYIPLF